MQAASVREGRPRTHRDERWLSDVWERQSFERRNLRSTSGLAFKVVFPGLRTGEAGPDFRDAILALSDGALLRGDVELHLESSGWRQHGHHKDPAYDRVLLHVVIENDAPAQTSRGEPILTLELAGRLGPRSARVEEVSPSPQLSYMVAPCQRSLPKQPPEDVRSTLQQLGLERFHAKQSVFEGELAVFDPEQALYAGLMEALGYSRNRDAFRQLASLVPVDALKCAGDASRMEALLLEGSGLSPASGLLPEAGIVGQPLASDGWQSTGVRPDNLPRRRIGQFAAIMARLLPRGLLDELLAPLVDAANAPFPRQQWQSQLAELGHQRVDAVAVNVLLPFATAYGQATCQFSLSEAAEEAFLAFPPEGANQVTSYMRRDILGPLGGLAQGAAGQQALLQVWDRWCHEKVCALCPLGRR